MRLLGPVISVVTSLVSSESRAGPHAHFLFVFVKRGKAVIYSSYCPKTAVQASDDADRYSIIVLPGC